MTSLLVRGQNGGVSVTPESAGWRYVSFNALRIPNGGRFLLETEGSEACIVVIAGRCAVRVGDVGWPHVGERATKLATRGILPRDNAQANPRLELGASRRRHRSCQAFQRR